MEATIYKKLAGSLMYPIIQRICQEENLISIEEGLGYLIIPFLLRGSVENVVRNFLI